jgi:hypothetical protein
MRMISRYSLVLLVVLAAMGCNDNEDNGNGPSGTLTIRMQDTPFSEAQAVLVTFSEVSAHKSGSGGFTRLPFSPESTSRTCDLKKLVGATDVLGTGALSAGHYTQLRLTVTSANLYFDEVAAGPACAPTITAPAGRSAPIEVPSGEVKLNQEFDVNGSNVTTITLDFDGDSSIRETGNGRFMLQPVITVVSVQ